MRTLAGSIGARGVPVSTCEEVAHPARAAITARAANRLIGSLPAQRELRAAVGTLCPAGLADREVDARMGVPQIHLRHRAGERQVLLRHLVLVLRVGLDERPGGSDHGGFFRGSGRLSPAADYTRTAGGAAPIVSSQMRLTAARSARNSSAEANAPSPASERWCAAAR